MQLPPKKHHQRGGRRHGAGRKPKPDARVQLSCRVAPDTLQALRAAGVPIGRAIDAALDWFANPRANPHSVAKAIGHEGWPHAVSIKAGEALAAEVRRLRAVLADINAIARLHPDESGREDFETLEVIADKTANELAEGRAQGGDKHE